jgi:hypothetical protein
MNMLKPLVSSLLLSLLAACGGGGGSSGTSGFDPVTPGGPTVPGALTATKLVLALSTFNISNTGAGTVTATATVTSDGGQVVAAVPVSFAVDNNAVFSVNGAKTDAGGTVAATISTGADKANRVVTVTAVSGSLTATAAFAVTGAKLTGVPVPAIVTPGSAGNRVDFRLVDANDVAMPRQAVTVKAGSLPEIVGFTDTAGTFVYTYAAPATTGPLDVTATAGGVSKTQTVLVQANGSNNIPAAVGSILSASVSANPSVTPTNTASTNNRVEVRALFVGANNAPIKNVRVKFDLDGDTNSIGGTFSTANNIVYSDANGVATTAYIPGALSSPTNGVTIRACYDANEFTNCSTVATSSTKITVASDPLAVTIGSNELIYTGVADLTYQRKFVVLVVDASGAAKENVQIKPSIDLTYYYKGRYSYTAQDGITRWRNYAQECLNEDENRNGIVENSEDLNGDGMLWPRKSDVAISMVGGALTNSSGIAIVHIEYPKNVATWAEVKILVSATGVSGTEGRASWRELLPAPATAFIATGTPAFVVSPYGYAFTPKPDNPIVAGDDATAVQRKVCANPN